MRALGVLAVLLVAACSQPSTTAGTSTPTPAPSPVAASQCKLPVWWGGDGSDVHAGFVSVPDGAVTDAGVLPLTSQTNQLGGAYGGTYEKATAKWMRASRPAVSPDGSRYAYWTADPAHGEVHLVDVATGADHTAYSGTVPYIVVGFESDAIYLAHIINARQGAFEHLYRLDPAGGTPQLVPGSDRHMDQYGWVLIADGAAWGIDHGVVDNNDVYSLLRLDLGTSQVTQWMEGPPGKMGWPLGVDNLHRLYAANYGAPLLRVDKPGQMVELSTQAQIYVSTAVGGPSGFVADARGVWISGQGSVWFYADGKEPRQFVVGSPGQPTYPAGTCLS